MLNPAPGSGPNMMGSLTQGMRASQDILLHVLRANADVLDTTRNLLLKIADTLEERKVEPKAATGRKAERVKVKVTKAKA